MAHPIPLATVLSYYYTVLGKVQVPMAPCKAPLKRCVGLHAHPFFTDLLGRGGKERIL